MKRLLAEAAVVLVVGLFLAFLANFLSPRGLALGHNPFPGIRIVPASPPASNFVASATNVATNSTFLADLISELKTNGLQVAESNQVIQLFRDPRFEQETIIFVDARDDRHYQEGHIPGAYQFDHYRPADYLAPVLAASQNAEKIVVYCNGGNCEDSKFAAISLHEAGVPGEKLFVYIGGMTEWSTNGLPVESGARKSGQFKETSK
jgi:rhodanese-related sulfurtransferase